MDGDLRPIAGRIARLRRTRKAERRDGGCHRSTTATTTAAARPSGGLPIYFATERALDQGSDVALQNLVGLETDGVPLAHGLRVVG
jgi:hypothetical protein